MGGSSNLGFVRWLPGLMGSAVLLALVASSAHAQTAEGLGYASGRFMRSEKADEDFVTGYLTTNGGKHGIAWSESAPTEDIIGPRASPTEGPAQKADADAGWTLRTNAGDDHGLIPTVTFTSDGAPRLLRVNSTRLIHFDLYFKGTCPYVDVELRVGDRFAGGSIAGLQPSPHSMPAAKAGFCVFAARLVPEIETIQAGEVFELKLLLHGPYPELASKSEYRSVLRIPVYPPEDVVLRVPLEELGTGPGTGPGAESAPWLPAAIGLAAMIAHRTRPRRALAIIAALAMVGTAGCLGGKGGGLDSATTDPANGGRASSSLVPDEGGALTANGTGAIVGEVSDDQSVPVKGAHISLLGTQYFTTSDKLGRFSFRTLPPATYHFRVDRETFFSYEGDAKVAPGNITRLDVSLQPLVLKEAGFRPHRHDDWNGESTKVLMDDDVLVGPRGTTHTACSNGYSSSPGVCKYAFFLPTGKWPVVLPGTRALDVTFTWGPETNVDRMGLDYVSNWRSDQQIYYGVNQSFAYPRGSGETAHVGVGWEMADVGHQKFTTWDFFAYVPTNGVANSYQTIGGPIHVKIVAVRGALPLEPAHPDFWGTNESLVVVDDATSAGCLGACNYGPSESSPSFRPTSIIPPETVWLDVRFGRVEPPAAAPVAPTWGILYKGAATPYESRVPADYKTPPPPTVEGETKRYIIRITDDEPDPFYAHRSSWRFMLEDGKDGYAPGYDSATFLLNVTAHRDPLPS